MKAAAFVVAGLVHVVVFAALAAPVDVPRTWDEQALHDWATPVAGLNLRPGHFSEAEYYRAPVDNLRTYPVYFPGREPAGYWDMLQTVGPKPLIEPATLQTEADWLEAGKRVFEELDTIGFRNFDAKAIARARELAAFAKSRRGRESGRHAARSPMGPDRERRGARPDRLRRVPRRDAAQRHARQRRADQQPGSPLGRFGTRRLGRVAVAAAARRLAQICCGVRGPCRGSRTTFTRR